MGGILQLTLYIFYIYISIYKNRVSYIGIPYIRPVYNRLATNSVQLLTTHKQSLGEVAGQEKQESSDLLCSSSWKALEQVKPNPHWGAGISLPLNIHRFSAGARGVWKTRNKLLPFRCCHANILNRKQCLLCGGITADATLAMAEGGSNQIHPSRPKSMPCFK